MPETLLVSICCITYNHAPYIRECLDGFLMQQCNFDFEILIHDDASTDGTQEIIKEYQQKYPDIIKPFFQTENQWSKGVRGMNQKYNFPRAKGKYIAMCEGDDYWTDPLKLQKQVDFLEENPEFGSCFHQYKFYFEAEKKFSKEIQPELNNIDSQYNGMTLDSESYFRGWFTQILTSLFRKELLLHHDPENFNFYRDNHLTYFLLKNNKSICFNWVAAVYRKHSNGIYSGISLKQNYITHYFIYEELLIKTADKRFYKLCNDMLNVLIKNFQFIELIDLYKKIKIYSFKRKLLFSYDKSQKKTVYPQLPIKERAFIIKEYIKNYAKILNPNRQLQ